MYLQASFLVWILSALEIKFNQAHNIFLLYPANSRSGHFLIKSIATGLADRGHQITAVTTFPLEKHQNITQFVIPLFRIGSTDKDELTLFTCPVDYFKYAIKMSYAGTKQILQNKDFQTILQSEKHFDLVLSADLPYDFACAIVEYKYQVPGISLLRHLPSNIPWMLGEHFNPAYHPEISTNFDGHMNFWERLYNTYSTLRILYLTYIWALPLHENLLDSLSDTLPFLKERPPLTDIIANKSLVILPSHPAIDYVHHQSDRMKAVAGLSIIKNKPLPEIYEQFLNNSPDGVILIAWGSLINGKKVSECSKILLSVFAKLKQNIIWKTNTSSHVALPPNVMIDNWIPQQDILAHQNLRLFMTHGGINSFTEATYYGVPMVVTPFFLDQFKNARKIKKSGAGIILHPDNFTTNSMIWAINEVINNENYKKSATRRSAMIRDRPMNPLDEAVYWIEYILKYGNILIPTSAIIPSYKILLLDVILLITVLIAVFSFAIKYFLKILFSKFCHEKFNMKKFN